MSEVFSKHDLLAQLRTQGAVMGLKVHDSNDRELVGEAESISARWWLGGRKVIYRMSCRPSEEDRTLHFREVVTERSWGLPPPAVTVEKSTVRGWKRTGERGDVAVGGGGTLDYARVREAVERTVTAAGWQFEFEGGRMP
jgi:hypothetical protein